MAQGIPATHLAGLEAFSGKVFSGAQGDFTLDNYSYFDDTSLFSTAFFPIASNAIAAGSTFNMFSVANGQRDTVLGRNLTTAETNLQGGMAGGKFPANQAYVALAGGFEVYLLSAGTAGAIGQVASQVPDAGLLHQIVSNISWTWNVGGVANPTILYEPIKLWPLGTGISGVSALDTQGFTAVPTAQSQPQGLTNGSKSMMRKFAFPLFFPPQVAVNNTLTVGRTIATGGAATACPSGTFVCVAFHLRGYMLSQIRG